ncbi:MAG: thiolase family protein [Candidatus Nitrosothermus koennekii]|nr:MAG: thiolase family protein [Candidatus Nitrosothermus koennekii]
MNVYASAYGITKFRKDNTSIYSLALESAIDLIKRFDIDKDSIDGVIIATSSIEPYIASIVSEMLGIKPKIAHKLEQMCSSGSSAIAAAYSYIYSGICKNVLVIGVDKHDTIGKRLDWDNSRGEFKHPAHWAALYAKMHMKAFNTTEEQLALVTVKNRDNAINNKYAYFQERITIDEVLNSKIVVDPIKLYECSYPCDGSAAILLSNKPSENSIKVTGIGEQSLGASISSITDFTSIESTRLAAKEAYDMAGIDASKVDIAEVHDAFTICEILAYEDLGFTERGKGGKFIENIDKIGIKINTRGGLLGTGHPVGATGIAQAAEIIRQLMLGYRIGLIHNMAAAGTTSNVIIMENEI